MASECVSSTYQSYEAGAEKILHWLYETAWKCGYGAEVLEQTDDEDDNADNTSHSEPKAKRKRKPKPRTNLRKGHTNKAKRGGKAKTEKRSATANTKTPQFVPVQEYKALAEGDVITGRKKCAQWFYLQANFTMHNKIKTSNKGHQHFIEVLEQVLAILKNTQEPLRKKTAESMNLNNIFDALDIEPDTEHTLTEPKLPKARDHKSSSPNISFESAESIEESYWLARKHLRFLWTEYKRGASDLATVALLTNTAFQTFKRAEEELFADLRSILPRDIMAEIKGYPQIQNLLFTATAMTRGLHPDCRRSPDDPYNYDLDEIADWTALPVYLLLWTYLQVIQRRGHIVPICKPEHRGTLNLNGDHPNPEEKYKQDKIFLCEHFIPEVLHLRNIKGYYKSGNIKLPAEDELTGGIFEMVGTNEIPIWLVLALQVQLDIYYTLLEDMDRPHSEPSAAASVAMFTVKEYQDFSRNMYT
ncbi:hypothetical protein HYALB_00003857 [Hymenoscyphus albidus]|uniref:DUF6604 domain-containing protein n=1 Tax=Hymenoscyphus albidus TaxID=595503 RepID=A0A9N9LU49_9HELO|nr:hypothetical protein HYALB_00003857 [Hymenoscyphus albidus]